MDHKLIREKIQEVRSKLLELEKLFEEECPTKASYVPLVGNTGTYALVGNAGISQDEAETKSNTYDEFVKNKLAELEVTDPEMSMEKRMKIIAEEWPKKYKNDRPTFTYDDNLVKLVSERSCGWY